MNGLAILAQQQQELTNEYEVLPPVASLEHSRMLNLEAALIEADRVETGLRDQVRQLTASVQTARMLKEPVASPTVVSNTVPYIVPKSDLMTKGGTKETLQYWEGQLKRNATAQQTVAAVGSAQEEVDNLNAQQRKDRTKAFLSFGGTSIRPMNVLTGQEQSIPENQIHPGLPSANIHARINEQSEPVKPVQEPAASDPNFWYGDGPIQQLYQSCNMLRQSVEKSRTSVRDPQPPHWAKSSTVASFDPDKNDVEDWLFSFELYAQVSGIVDPIELVAALTLKLQDKTLAFYRTLMPDVKTDYSRLREKLIGRFGDKRPASERVRDFDRLRQGNRPVLEYYEDLERCISKVYPEKLTTLDPFVQDRFERGMQPALSQLYRMRCGFQPPKTIEDMVRLAIEAEGTLSSDVFAAGVGLFSGGSHKAATQPSQATQDVRFMPQSQPKSNPTNFRNQPQQAARPQARARVDPVPARTVRPSPPQMAPVQDNSYTVGGVLRCNKWLTPDEWDKWVVDHPPDHSKAVNEDRYESAVRFREKRIASRPGSVPVVQTKMFQVSMDEYEANKNQTDLEQSQTITSEQFDRMDSVTQAVCRGLSEQGPVTVEQLQDFCPGLQ